MHTRSTSKVGEKTKKKSTAGKTKSNHPPRKVAPKPALMPSPYVYRRYNPSLHQGNIRHNQAVSAKNGMFFKLGELGNAVNRSRCGYVSVQPTRGNCIMCTRSGPLGYKCAEKCKRITQAAAGPPVVNHAVEQLEHDDDAPVCTYSAWISPDGRVLEAKFVQFCCGTGEDNDPIHVNLETTPLYPDWPREELSNDCPYWFTINHILDGLDGVEVWPGVGKDDAEY